MSTCKLPWKDARVRPSWLLWCSHLLAVSRWPDPVPFGVRKRSGQVLVASFFGVLPWFLIVPWEESLASLAGGGDAPSNRLGGGGGGGGGEGDAKRCGPPLFLIYEIYHDM